MDIDQEQNEFISDKGNQKCVHNVAARDAISLSAEHEGGC
jgi:hypothetical protein